MYSSEETTQKKPQMVKIYPHNHNYN